MNQSTNAQSLYILSLTVASGMLPSTSGFVRASDPVRISRVVPVLKAATTKSGKSSSLISSPTKTKPSTVARKNVQLEEASSSSTTFFSQ